MFLGNEIADPLKDSEIAGAPGLGPMMLGAGMTPQAGPPDVGDVRALALGNTPIPGITSSTTLATPAPAGPASPLSLMPRDTSGYAQDQAQDRAPVDQDPVNVMHQQMLSGQSDVQKARQAVTDLYTQYPHLKGMTFTKNDLPKLIPLIIGLMSGRNGQQFAGAYGMGLLKGKQSEADLANQNATNAFGAQLQGATSNLQGAQEALGNTRAEYSNLINQKRMEMMYGLGNPKELSQQVKSWEDQVKANKGGTAPALVALDRMFTTTGGKIGRPIDPNQYQQAVANDASYQKTVEATGNQKQSVADKNAEQQRGLQIANDFKLAVQPTLINREHIKNTKLLADIDGETKRAAAAVKNADSAAKRAEAVLGMDSAHANLYGAMAASVGPRTKAYLDDTYQKIASMQNRDAESLGKGDKAEINKSLNNGISALKGEIDSVNTSIRSANKQIQDLMPLVAAEGDNDKGQAHQQVSQLQSQIDTWNTRLNNVLYPSEKQLRGQAGSLRQALGMNPDGSISKKKPVATGATVRPTPEPGRTVSRYTPAQMNAARQQLSQKYGGNVPAPIKARFKSETGVDF